MINVLNPDTRRMIIDEIESYENRARKRISLAQFEIYKDRLLPYVKDYLKDFYAKDTIKEMPIVASINLAKRIVDEQGAIYEQKPKRRFLNVTEQQAQALEALYQALKVDTYMKKANRYYKLQEQTHLQVVMANGKLQLRTLLAHHLDAIPNDMNPEIADAYIISGYDRSMDNIKLNDNEDGLNQSIADSDDYKANAKMYSVWASYANFNMDKNGNIVSPDAENALGLMPIVEVSDAKDSEYWVRLGSAITDFCIQFNASLSDLAHIVRMQGFAQAIVTGAPDVIMKNLQIGPNFVLRLAVDPNNPVPTDFKYANPNPDLEGSIAYLENLLSAFLTSRGLDPALVNGKGQSIKFNSGLERLLAMIDMFKPSREDFDVFIEAEKNLFKIIKQYLNVYGGTDLLNINLGQIPEAAELEIIFSEPQDIETEDQRLDRVAKKKELNVITDVEAIAEARGLSPEEAIAIKAEIDAQNRRQIQAAIGASI